MCRFFTALMIGRFYEACDERERKREKEGDVRFMSTRHDALSAARETLRHDSGVVEKRERKTVDKLSKLMSNAFQDRLEFFSSALKVQRFSFSFFIFFVIQC